MDHPGPWERLRWLAGRMLAGIQYHPEGLLLVLHAVATEAVPKPMQEEALRKGERVREVVRTLVADGQAAGEVAAGDPDELAGLFLACIQGLAAGAAFPLRWRAALPAVDTLLRILEQKPTPGVLAGLSRNRRPDGADRLLPAGAGVVRPAHPGRAPRAVRRRTAARRGCAAFPPLRTSPSSFSTRPERAASFQTGIVRRLAVRAEGPLRVTGPREPWTIPSACVITSAPGVCPAARAGPCGGGRLRWTR